MKKMFAVYLIALTMVVFCSFAFAGEQFVKVDKLNLEDVQDFLTKNIGFEAEADGRSIKITEFFGVYQNDNAATIFFNFGSVIEQKLNTCFCLHFNDGRWFCRASAEAPGYPNKFDLNAFLTK